MKVLLASKSPRRQELLQNLGYRFDTVSIDCEEIYPENLEAEKIAEYLSELKSEAYQNLSENEVLITADTVVALNGEILGKPSDKIEAKLMLQKLSGKTHWVYTGITLRSTDKKISATDAASVTLSELTEEEIDYYIENFRPFDKAGSYGVQEWLGMAKISEIKGSFYTIMGLPTHLLYRLLQDFQ